MAFIFPRSLRRTILIPSDMPTMITFRLNPNSSSHLGNAEYRSRVSQGEEKHYHEKKQKTANKQTNKHSEHPLNNHLKFIF